LPDIESLYERHDCGYRVRGAAAANFVPSPLFSVKHVNGKPRIAQKMFGKTFEIKGFSRVRG
jgi:hypothetical protein